MTKPRSKFKKVKWLFGKEIEIPEEWEWSELGKEGNLSSGATPSRNHPEYYKGSIPWVSSGELDYNIIKYTHEAITLLAVRKTNLKIHPKDTFLFAITGLEAKGTRGRCAILGINAATNQSCMAFNESDSLSPKFLFYYFLLFGEKIIFSLAQGTKQQSLNLHLSTKIQIPIPEHKEQEKIVSILSGVNAAIEATQKVIEKTEMLKKGLMQELLTRGIGHTEFKKVKWHFERETKIPEEWVLQKFDEVVKTNPPTKIKQNIVPYIPMDAVDTEKPSFNYFEERRLSKNSSLPKFQNNDVLFARITPSTENGKTSIVENFGLNGVASSELTVLRASKMVLPRYLYYYVKSYRIRQFAISQMMGTTGRQRVPNSVFKKVLNFELPPLSEQQKIASILSRVDAYIQKNQEYKKKMERLKKGLMQKLLTGQIRVKIDH